MNVISRRALQEAARQHPQGRNWIEQWYRVARRARWTNLDDTRADYASADLVGSCLVFNAPQGHRLIARVVFADQHQNGTLFIVGYLTHAEYDLDHWKERCC
jgi:mRNA interferase HigB